MSSKHSATEHQIYLKFRRMRHEGFLMRDCLRASGIGQRRLFAVLEKYRRHWAEDLKESSLTDLQIVRLLWGEIEGQDLIACEKWIANLRSGDTKGSQKR